MVADPSIGIDFQAKAGNIIGCDITGGDVGIRIGGAPTETIQSDYANVIGASVDLTKPSESSANNTDSGDSTTDDATSRQWWRRLSFEVVAGSFAAVVGGLILWFLTGA